jgi:hypothetical protein
VLEAWHSPAKISEQVFPRFPFPRFDPNLANSPDPPVWRIRIHKCVAVRNCAPLLRVRVFGSAYHGSSIGPQASNGRDSIHPMAAASLYPKCRNHPSLPARPTDLVRNARGERSSAMVASPVRTVFIMKAPTRVSIGSGADGMQQAEGMMILTHPRRAFVHFDLSSLFGVTN